MARTNDPTPEFIFGQSRAIISPLALKGKKSKTGDALTNPSTQEVVIGLHRLGLLLTSLNDDVQMTPTFKEKSKIDLGMEAICNEQHKFPPEYVEKAKALLKKWKGESWGAPVAVKRESENDNESDTEVNNQSDGRESKKRKLSTQDAEKSTKLLLPPANHPIWGLNGIMHGICYSQSQGRKSQQMDRRYKHKQRRADTIGDNGLEVGQWFPSQLAALFRGAHGSAQAGIYGGESSGAYSIIIAGQYDDLDSDYGNFIYYSGSGSHANEDPKSPPPSTHGTRALKTSMQREQPVRVLRSATGKSKWAPTRGVRYDGFYTVESVSAPYNAKGGKYERFRLVRIEDQDPINQSRPNSREVHHYDQIRDGFPRVRDV